MQHHDHTVSLPLRLAAEPYAKEGISPSCVSLGIASNSDRVELAALADDDGIHAFCVSELLTRDKLLQRLQAAVPSADLATTGWKTQALLLLVRVNNSHHTQNPNLMQWYWLDQHAQDAKPIAADAVQGQIQKNRPIHNAIVAELITNSIRHYYQQQILEPSVRGFLSVLEKQFARADLYLFELLQNAVDDGATVVKFELRKGSSLHMTHNGRQFTPLDVLGLSSVGLSTKSRQGKRTIGFMGVGFKAVYKRYARVSIDDGTYRFIYQEPPDNKLGYGWVMLPLWQTKQQQQSIDDSSHNQTGWCHFALEQPRGGPSSIQRDLLVLPRTAPPLLGRAALLKAAHHDTQPKWSLDWNGKQHTIERSNIAFYSSKKTNGSELITVTISNNKSNTTKTNHWLFVTHRYKPSKDALETYQNHTKRSHEGLEEVCGFVPLIGNTHNIPQTLSTSAPPSGWVHSILPTKIRMPVPMNFQGSWLLSVDRQQVQDLTDNAWNREILQQFPQLIATLFRWAASKQLNSAAHYQAICQLLPSISSSNQVVDKERHRTCGVIADILGQQVSLKALEQALWSEPILPVGVLAKSADDVQIDEKCNDSKVVESAFRMPSFSTSYYDGSKSIWVPPSWFEFLDADFLRGWLGKRPLRTDFMGDAAFHPLFALEHAVCQLKPLPMRTSQLETELGLGPRVQHIHPDSVWKTIRLMAAIGSCYDEYPQSASLPPHNEIGPPKKQQKLNNNKSNNRNRRVCNQDTSPVDTSIPSLPSVTDWPVFITENGGLARLDQIVLPGADFAELPEKLISLLRPYFIKENTDLREQKFGGGKRDKKKKRSPPLIRVHNRLESIMCMVGRYDTALGTTPEEFETNQAAWDKVATSASSFLERAREALPANVVDVATAALNLLETYSAKHKLSDVEISTILQIGKFAVEKGNHLLLKYVLVDVSSNTVSPSRMAATSTRLVNAAMAYVGKATDENGPGADLENFAGSKLLYLSSRYNSIIDTTSAAMQRKAVKLFAFAGVQTGMSISVSVATNVDKDKRLLERILPKLPDGKLPTLRKNATKCDVVLPYGLGVVMNRKKFYLLDSKLPDEWERLATAMTPTSAIGFISLLLSIPFDNATIVTPSNVVAAANCLAGRSEPDEGSTAPVNTAKLSKHTAAPLRQRLFFLPPGQAGAKAMDIAEAQLVEQLSSIKWLPCSVPSIQQQAHLTLLRPREVLLEADSSRPEMPLVELPASVLTRLKASKIAQALTWGTQAPPPPVGELVELTREAKQLLVVDHDKTDKEAVAVVASRMYDVWIAVCRSHLRDGLSQTDKKTLRMLATSPGIPVRRVVDSGGSGFWIVPTNRCVRMPDSLPEGKSENETLKGLTVLSLVASDFICDFSHSTHNPFFHQPEVSSAVVQLAGIRSLVELPTNALIGVCGLFVRHCCTAEPVISSRTSPLRESFSFCLNWCVDSPTELPKKGQGLKLYVRHGPGMGTKALPAGWVQMKKSPVQVVLNDNKTRSALLSPEMKIQLLGVLDHSENERDCPNAKMLSRIDAKIIKALGILRLSDNRFVVKTRARGTPTLVGGGATSKLQLVCALLKEMELDRLNSMNNSSTGGNKFLDQTYDPPLMIRHDSLTRQFQAPGMEAPSSIPLYAMFGRAPKFSQKRCILVSGEPDDYTMELEELVLDHVGVPTSSTLTQTKPYRAAVRLLSHLENDTSFHKFVQRDFADFEATLSWKNLMERKDMVAKLREAEKKKDRHALRKLLLQAEKMFDNDDDNGDSILQSARDLLVKLEEEWAKTLEERNLKEKEEEATTKIAVPAEGEEASTSAYNPSTANLGGNQNTLEGRGRGRGIDNRPAWMASQGVENESGQATTNGSVKAESEEEDVPVVSSTKETLTGTGCGRGMGRTLPAWMSSADGPSRSPQRAMSPEINESEEIADTTAAGGTGPTLPAWMTSNARSTAEQPQPQQEQMISASEQAKSILSSILNDAGGSPPAMMEPPTAVGSPPPTVESLASGRGRGVSNLPAWMTNNATQDRLAISQSSSIADEAEDGPSLKRTRPSSPSDVEGSMDTEKPRLAQESFLRLTLGVNILPTQETDFLAWFQSNVKEEVSRRGGSLSLSIDKTSR